MGNKRLAINLIANTISYGTTAVIAFFLTPYLVTTIGKEAYSFYPLANNFVNYMSVVTISLNSMASRFITIEFVKDDKIKANKYFVSVLYSNIAMSLLLLIPMIIIIIFLDGLLNIPLSLISSVRILFLLVFLSMIINVITAVFGVAVFVKNKLEYKSIAEIIVGILRVTLYVTLFSLFKPEIYYVGLVAFIISITLFLFNFGFTKRLLPDLKISKKFYDFKLVKEIFTSGIWNSVNQIGAILLTSVSLLFSNIYLGASEAGIYAITLTIPSFINGIISMLTAVFMPSITHRFAQGNKEKLLYEVKKSQKIMGLVTNIPITIYMAVGLEFFSLWMPTENPYKLQTLSLLVIGHLIITGVVWPVSNLNIVMNKVKTPSLYMLFSGVLNIILIVLLLNTTSLGVYAIAITAFIINLIWVGVFIPIYPTIIMKISKTTFYPPVFKSLIGGVLIYLFTFKIKSLIAVTSWNDIIIISVISGLFGLFLNALIIFGPERIKEYIKYYGIRK